MKKIISITLLCAGLFLSCKKDLIPIITQPAYNDLEYGWIEEEDDTTFQQVGLGNLSPLGMQFRYPQFNPSNPNELIFVKQHFQENIHQLIKYNLKTKKQTILVDGMQIDSELSWSSSGWIAFSTLPSHHLYRVREDGSQLTLVSDISMSWLPSWSPDGNYLYFAQEFGTPHVRWVRLEVQTNTLDTLIYSISDPNFMYMRTKISSHNKALTSANINGEGYYVTINLNAPFIELSPVFNPALIENGNGITDYRCWSPSGDFFFLSFYSVGRIYRIGVATGDIMLVRDRYHGSFTEAIDASPDGKYLAVQRVELSNRFNPDGGINYAGFFTKSKIQLTDLATGKIKILDL